MFGPRVVRWAFLPALIGWRPCALGCASWGRGSTEQGYGQRRGLRPCGTIRGLLLQISCAGHSTGSGRNGCFLGFGYDPQFRRPGLSKDPANVRKPGRKLPASSQRFPPSGCPGRLELGPGFFVFMRSPSPRRPKPDAAIGRISSRCTGARRRGRTAPAWPTVPWAAEGLPLVCVGCSKKRTPEVVFSGGPASRRVASGLGGSRQAVEKAWRSMAGAIRREFMPHRFRLARWEIGG